MAARIFDSYRWADDPTSKRASGLKEQKALEALVPDLWSDYQGLYKDYQTKYKSYEKTWSKLWPEYNYQKSRETPDWTKYKSLSSASDKAIAISNAAERKVKAALSKHEESVGKQVFSPEEFDERYGAEGTGKGQWNYTNPEGTFTRSGDLWKNIATGKLRNPDSFRNLDGTPVLERQDLEGEKADAEQQERIEKETWGIVRDKKKPAGGQTLAERLRSLNAVAMADPLPHPSKDTPQRPNPNAPPSSPYEPGKSPVPSRDDRFMVNNNEMKIAESTAAGSYGGYFEVSPKRGFISPEQGRRMLANPKNFNATPGELRIIRENLPQASIKGTKTKAKGSSWDQYLQRNVLQIPDIAQGKQLYGKVDSINAFPNLPTKDEFRRPNESYDDWGKRTNYGRGLV